ncbi:MAG: hypothetical protein NC089_07255 [Bacteroides sp.]|nr:hypothetical protein [Bacteroides sp.]MCM1548353.1 hypothetical protein [Clostridium sp.]
MKKRGRGPLFKTMSVLLSAILVMGMLLGAAPVELPAEEDAISLPSEVPTGDAASLSQEVPGTDDDLASNSAGVASVAEVSIDNSISGWIYLNGTAVIITEGSDSSKTKLYYDANENGSLDEGELPIELSEEEGTVEDGYDLSETTIYGGSSSEEITSDIMIHMLGGALYRVEGTMGKAVNGNFCFFMTGGSVTQILSAGGASLNGSSDIVIGGDAVVTETIYGGGENDNITIGGNVNITVEGNARVGSGYNYPGIFAGGQQPNNVIMGTSTITVKGGTINGNIYSDLQAADFRDKVTLDIQGGTVTGFVQGIVTGQSKADVVEIRMSGGTVEGSVFGVRQAYVENVSIHIDGGEIKGQVVGSYAGKSGKVSIEITDGTVRNTVIGRAVPGQTDDGWEKGSIIIRGGNFHNSILLRHNNAIATPNEAEICIEGKPVFGENAGILLRNGDFITQTGRITSATGSIPIDVQNINQKGTLIVVPGNGIELSSEPFALLNSDFDLIFGTIPDTNQNLYLGEKHTCSYSEAWKSDAEQHWHICEICGRKADIAAHTEDAGIVTREPTETETGIKTYACSACGYEMREEILPKKETENNPDDDNPGEGDQSGVISQEVKTEGNVPVTNISMTEKELIEAVLTEADKAQVESGTDIKILLTVEDASGSVSDADKALVASALNGYQLGQYLDISLFKIIGNNQNRIVKTQGLLRLVITIPDSLKNTKDNEKREFAIIRIHNGAASILNDMDGNVNTITIDTDRFSTYVIVYQDKAVSGGDGGNSNSTNNNNEGSSGQKDKEPKTGDNTISLEIYATIAMIAGLSYLFLYLTGNKNGMTEEEKNSLMRRIIRWAHQGGSFRIPFAFVAIFLLLAYYHSIGKTAAMEWKEII